MSKNFEEQVIELLEYVCNNYDHVKHIVQTDIYESRNLAASLGLELTPDEVRDCMMVLKWMLENTEC